MEYSALFDMHLHTIASGHGAADTITDMARKAKENGLAMIGISDHGPATVNAAKPPYFQSLPHTPRKRFGVDVLFGVELNILDYNGTVDLDDKLLKKLDYAIVSMHLPNISPGTPKQNTAAYIGAMNHPKVKIIGHWDDSRYPVQIDTLLKAAIDRHVFLEINNSSLSPDSYRGDTRRINIELLNLCKQYHYPVILGSDSHGARHCGDFRHCIELLQLTGFPKELVLNAWYQYPFHF